MAVLVCFLIISTLYGAQSYVLDNEKYDVCTTASCNASAQYFLSAMNKSVDPCDDFYEFACGGWIEKNGIAPFTTFTGVTVELTLQALHNVRDALESLKTTPTTQKSLNIASQVYQNCVNAGPETESALLKDLRKDLRSIGGWPIMDPKWDASKFDVFKTLALVRRKYNIELGLKMTVGPDITNGEQNIVHVQTPFGWGSASVLPQRDKRSSHNEDIFNIKQKHELYMNVVCWVNPNCTRDEDFVHDSSIAVGIEQGLELIAAIGYSGMQPQSNSFNRKVGEKTHPYLRNFQDHKSQEYSVFIDDIMQNPDKFKITVKDTQKHLDEEDHKFVLLDYLNDVLSDSGTKLTASDKIYVVPQSLHSITSFFENSDLRKRDLANIIAYKLVTSRLSLVSSKYRYWFQDLNKEDGLTTAPGWFQCVLELDQLMPHAIGRLFAEKLFTEEKKNAAQELVEDLREGTKELLYDALGNWMDPETHREAIKKLNNIKENVAYPDWIMDDNKLNSFYDIDEKNVSGPLDLVRKLSKKLFDFEFQNVFGHVDRDNSGWKVTSPMTVNAFYFPPMNIIVFPGAFINFPVFALDRPKAVNFGGIGWIIGHEITHGFDNDGRKFGFQGRVHDWWTSSTAQRFDGLAQCFVDQYGNITNVETGNLISGVSTLGENIADNGGLREAFKAHRKAVTNTRLIGLEGMDQDQLFFLSAANMWCVKTRPGFSSDGDIHSPERYRVLVPFKNNHDFAKAFKCPSGSPMNPEKKCVLW